MNLPAIPPNIYLFCKTYGLDVVIFGIGAFIGKLISDTRLEKLKQKHSIKTEELKQKHSIELKSLETSLEISKSQKQQYKQIELERYFKLWDKLFKLQIIADQLWDEATENNLYSFVEAFKEAKEALGSAEIVLELEHCNKSQELMSAFEKFEVGKVGFLKIKDREEFDYLVDENCISATRLQIDKNRLFKKEYDALMERIRESFYKKF